VLTQLVRFARLIGAFVAHRGFRFVVVLVLHPRRFRENPNIEWSLSATDAPNMVNRRMSMFAAEWSSSHSRIKFSGAMSF
jgi:hypothetical protein